MKSSIILTMITAFRPQPQLYGEWTIWHSHNPSFKGSNRMLVGLYPESNIEVSYREYNGPWMIETRKIGTFTIDNDFTYDNKIKTDFDPIFKSNVCIKYEKEEKRVLSFLGIGFDDISPLRVENHNVTLFMKLYIVDKNDLFLTNSRNEHYHLMRSIRVNEPSINVPISTLIATNLIGMIMTAIIQHHYLTN